jgi:hypothetical protein
MTKVAVAALADIFTTIEHSGRPLTFHVYPVVIAQVTDYHIHIVHA